MDSLELRFYPHKELAEIAGLDPHNHNFTATMRNRLKNWCHKLCNKGTMWISTKYSQSATLWHTYKKDGKKIQEPADPDGPKYKEYSVKRAEMLKDFKEMGMGSRERWATMIRLLFNEYGVYYKCKYIDLPAFGPEIQEITDLTYEIMINT